MRIATYNVNSIRQRLPIVLDWLAEHEPDVVAIQETKVEDHLFPVAEIEDLGYQVAIHGQKAYNGVAIIARSPITNVRMGFDDPTFPEDARILSATIDGVEIVDTYVPNGTQVGTDKFDYKLRWLERFAALIQSRYRPEDRVVWLGDINIAPTPHDVYDSKKVYGGVGHHPAEFERLNAIVELGFADCFRKFTQGGGHYTYFDYFIRDSVDRNRGWRIDHIYASPAMYESCSACEIDPEPRNLPKPSDHTIVWADFA